MQGAACINDDVVAFNDGALHVVVGRCDLRAGSTADLVSYDFAELRESSFLSSCVATLGAR